MFQINYPKFNSGRILKKEMLEGIKNYPLKLVETFYYNYQDGIISGFDVKISGNSIVIEPGILKHDGDILVMDTSFEVPYTATETVTLLKIKVLPVVEDEDYYTKEATIQLSTDMQVRTNEWELMRFKLKEGAYLRVDYQSFEDLVTEYNTVNFIYQKRSLKKNMTISPIIIQQFCQWVEKIETTNSLDHAFCMQAMMNQWLVDRKVIEFYIASRLAVKAEKLSSLNIHEQLNQILIKIKHDKKEEGIKRQRSRKMIVE